MCWDAGCHIFGYSVKLDVYRIWNYTIRNHHVAEVFPLLRYYQILSLKNKRKFFFIGGFKQAIQLRFTGVSSR